MYTIWNALSWCVRVTDRLVFGEKHLSKSHIDVRTLACFVVSSIAFFVGIGAGRFMEYDFAIFLVWLCASAPMALVFIARHQRLRS